MIKLRNVLNEGISKKEMNAIGKDVNKAVQLIEKAKGILENAATAVRSLENKDDSSFKDTESVSRSLYNLRGSIRDSMAYSLKDPIKYSRDILTRITAIGKKL